MFSNFNYWPDTFSYDEWDPEKKLPLELKSGEFAGYKLLHHACIHNYTPILSLLQKNNNLNPTAKADDGVQPIELAAFKGNFDMVDKLVELGCSIHAELSHDHYVKHKKEDHNWNSTFTDKMPLFFYLFFNKHDIKKYFKYNPNLTLLGSKNKTLLMRAIKNGDERLIEFLVKNLVAKELNRRDDNGFAAIHYLFKYQSSCFYLKSQRLEIVKSLYERGANLDVMGNNGPESLPIHIAAFNGYFNVLNFLLKKQTYFNLKARPLFYGLESSNNFNVDRIIKKFFDMNKFKRLIIEDRYVKYLFGYPVHTEEVKLLGNYIIKDLITSNERLSKSKDIKNLVDIYEIKYEKLIPVMKSHKVLFGDSEMSIYDVVTASYRTYEKVARNDNYHPACMIFPASNKMDNIYDIISERLQATKKRIAIREQWGKLVVLKLITYWLIPYDCLLHIFEYLTNNEWQSFNEMYADDDC